MGGRGMKGAGSSSILSTVSVSASGSGFDSCLKELNKTYIIFLLYLFILIFSIFLVLKEHNCILRIIVLYFGFPLI
ncbi:MAG: hypothetical protein ACK559_19115, partial [bacterium]